MNKIECESCIKRKTIYCPNSEKCFATKDKPFYQNRIMLLEENKQLKQQIEYIRSGEYYNQLRFERDMLQNIVDTNGVPSEVYDYIECLRHNTKLLEEKQELIDYLKEKIKEYEEKCNNTCVFLEQDRCETRINTYKEILSKIEKR